MKSILVMALSFVLIQAKAQENNVVRTGPNGGLLKTVQYYNIEMLQSISSVNVYVFDKSLNPLSNNGILAEIIFCYAHDVCLNKSLIADNRNGFFVTITNSQFDYCDIHLFIDGKEIQVKFNNSTCIAEK
jgi:hypothetical protein